MSERKTFAKAYMDGLVAVLANLPTDDLDAALGILSTAHDAGATVYLAGNGGSAGTANHMANDLMLGVAQTGGRGFAVISLSANVPVMTALANDEGYDKIFSAQLRTLGAAGDVLVVITGSGNSPNVLEAAQAARDKGMKVVGFLGMDGGKAKALCDVAVVVPSRDYGHIEDVHMMLDHLTAAWFRVHAARN